MKLAALCCTFRRPHTLGQLVESFLRQDYPSELRELVILDDAGQYENQSGDGWRLVSIAVTAARRLKDREQLKDTMALKKEIDIAKMAFGRVHRMIEILERDPKDPQANTAAGKYYCLVKGEWEKGLPLLRNSDDAALRLRADMEFEDTSTTKMQVELADAWWALSKVRNDHAAQLQLRAVYWYYKALPQLKRDLVKVKAELRIREAQEEHGKSEVRALRDRVREETRAARRAGRGTG